MTTDTILRLRISLLDIKPEIWRAVEVPVTISLRTLHDIVQAAMVWENRHLWHFEAGDRRYGRPDPEWPDQNLADARNVRLAALLARGVRQLVYTYDYGDDWRHLITVEAVEPSEADRLYPRFVTGERQSPPEDVGGFPGFEPFLEAMADPAHPEHADLLRWHGGPFDPTLVDRAAIDNALAAIARPRQLGRAAFEKSRRGR